MIELVKPVYAQGFKLKDSYGFGQFDSLGGALSSLIMPAFAIAGIAVVFYFVIGAFKFLTSAGDKNAVASGRDMITHAIIGFILLMMLFLLFQFISQFFMFNIPVSP